MTTISVYQIFYVMLSNKLHKPFWKNDFWKAGGEKKIRLKKNWR